MEQFKPQLDNPTTEGFMMTINTTSNKMAERVRMLYNQCVDVRNSGEISTNGFVLRPQGHTEKLDAYRDEIYRLLGNLPASTRHGASWKEFMYTSDAVQWGGARPATMLIALGMLAGFVDRVYRDYVDADTGGDEGPWYRVTL